MHKPFKVQLKDSGALLSVNSSGGCYIEFRVKGPAGSVAYSILPRDLPGLIAGLQEAARRSGYDDEEAVIDV